MKMLSSFTHPQVVLNLYEFILLLNTKEQFLVSTDFQSFYSYYGSQCGPATVWLFTIFKISSFVFNRKEKQPEDE